MPLYQSYIGISLNKRICTPTVLKTEETGEQCYVAVFTDEVIIVYHVCLEILLKRPVHSVCVSRDFVKETCTLFTYELTSISLVLTIGVFTVTVTGYWLLVLVCLLLRLLDTGY